MHRHRRPQRRRQNHPPQTLPRPNPTHRRHRRHRQTRQGQLHRPIPHATQRNRIAVR
jgi:hypothetical protein